MAEMRKKKKRRSPEGRFCHFNVHRLYRCRINDNQKLRPRKIEKKSLILFAIDFAGICRVLQCRYDKVSILSHTDVVKLSIYPIKKYNSVITLSMSFALYV